MSHASGGGGAVVGIFGSVVGCLFGAEEKPASAGHTCFNAVKLAREHKKSRNWSRSHHVSKKKKMGNRRIRPRSGRKSGAPKAPEPSVGLGFRVRVSVRASHGQNTSCVGIFAYLLKNSSFGVADFSSAPNNSPKDLKNQKLVISSN